LTGAGQQELLVQVWSPEDNGSQPRGKQTLYPGGIMYTSASGLWQSAWLEPVATSGVQNLVMIPDIDNSRLRLTVNTYSSAGATIYATALSNSIPVATVHGSPGTELDIPITNADLWTPDNPFLYNLRVSVVVGAATNDSVTSYFGMRKISTNFAGGVDRIYLNNQPIFGMGPLDQGYWPDGIYTAPTDDALKFDLQITKALGYNTIRKHEKVEPQR
jgi:beta-galactosidase/beta-glucuronidase